MRELPVESLQRPRQRVPVDERPEDAVGGVDDERRGLAETEEAERVVDVAVREDDAGDGRASSGSRPQLGARRDLRVD